MARIRSIVAPLTGLVLIVVSSQLQTGVASASPPARAPAVIAVSGTSANGHLRCTATFPESLHPGSPTGMQMFLKNRTGHRIHFGAGPSGRLDVSKNGSKLWETGLDFFPSPPPPPLDIRAHKTKRLRVADVAIRWGGTLVLQPICSGLHISLPTVTLPVDVPGPTPSAGSALSAAIGRMAGVFDHCTPSANDAGVNGTFAPPDGSRKLPDLDMHCWADVQKKAGFDVVDLHLVSPHDAPRISLPISDVPNATFPKKFMQAATWEFLVSDAGTSGLGMYFESVAPRNRHARAFQYSFHKGTWNRYGGPCGDGEIVWGPGIEVLLNWMNRCFGSPGDRASPATIPVPTAPGATVRSLGDGDTRMRTSP